MTGLARALLCKSVVLSVLPENVSIFLYMTGLISVKVPKNAWKADLSPFYLQGVFTVYYLDIL